MSTLARRSFPAPELEPAATLAAKLKASETGRKLDNDQAATRIALLKASVFWTGAFCLLLGVMLGGCLVVWLATGAM